MVHVLSHIQGGQDLENINHTLTSIEVNSSLPTYQGQDSIINFLWDCIEALVSAINARARIPMHSIRVARYAVMLAKQFGISRVELEKIRLGALMHDIGQIIYPDSLLVKKGIDLTSEEIKIIQSHTTEGIVMISQWSDIKFLIPYIQDHQERYDGSGYPRGLKGDEISIEVQIVSIADVYEALRFPREFHRKKSLSHSDAIKIIKQEINKRWSDEVVTKFIQLDFSEYDNVSSTDDVRVSRSGR
jgi:putative nucleotidyltransferase with HDIG domain